MHAEPDPRVGDAASPPTNVELSRPPGLVPVRGSRFVPHVSRQTGTTSNVIGVVEGSDARLAREAVVFAAHYDGFGKDSEGVVYAGAGGVGFSNEHA